MTILMNHSCSQFLLIWHIACLGLSNLLNYIRKFVGHLATRVHLTLFKMWKFHYNEYFIRQQNRTCQTKQKNRNRNRNCFEKFAPLEKKGIIQENIYLGEMQFKNLVFIPSLEQYISISFQRLKHNRFTQIMKLVVFDLINRIWHP